MTKKTIKLTRNQKLVFNTLTKSAKPLSAYSILDQLRSKGFKAPLQVYRALTGLQKLNLVHRIESLNAFVSCNHSHETGSDIIAFAICSDCGQVSEFCDTAIAKQITNAANLQNFVIKNTTIELDGQCTDCVSTNKSATSI